MSSGTDNVPFGDGCCMVLVSCRQKHIREMMIWQFAAICKLAICKLCRTGRARKVWEILTLRRFHRVCQKKGSVIFLWYMAKGSDIINFMN